MLHCSNFMFILNHNHTMLKMYQHVTPVTKIANKKANHSETFQTFFITSNNKQHKINSKE